MPLPGGGPVGDLTSPIPWCGGLGRFTLPRGSGDPLPAWGIWTHASVLHLGRADGADLCLLGGMWEGPPERAACRACPLTHVRPQCGWRDYVIPGAGTESASAVRDLGRIRVDSCSIRPPWSVHVLHKCRPTLESHGFVGRNTG